MSRPHLLLSWRSGQTQQRRRGLRVKHDDHARRIEYRPQRFGVALVRALAGLQQVRPHHAVALPGRVECHDAFVEFTLAGADFTSGVDPVFRC